MNPKQASFSWLALLALATINAPIPSVLAQGTAFSYQGQLRDNGSPASGTYNLQFSLYTTNTGGTAVAGPVADSGVVITNGLFTVTIDFGSSVWNGGTNWLQIAVETNGATTFTNLTPRQELTPTPYAIFAEGANAAGLSGTIPASDLSGTYSGALTLNNSGNSFTGNGTGLMNVNAATLGGLGAGKFWQTLGNAGTSAGVNFVGTTDLQPLYLDVNGVPILKLATNNSIVMANGTLGTGSSINYEVALGESAKATGNGSIAIGWNPTSSGPGSVAIGESVGSSANDSFASGGYTQASAQNATAMGFATVASGNYSMALGYEAQAVHEGTFVWADDSGGTFTSTGVDQFLIRAQGGVGIGTTSGPQQGLSVNAGMNIDQANLNGGFLNNGNTNGYGLSFGSSSGEGIASKRTAGGNQHGLDFYTGSVDRMSLDSTGDLTINGQNLFLTSGSTATTGNGLGYWNGLPGSGLPGSAGPFLFGYYGGALGAVGPTTVCLSWDYSGDVWVSNNLSTATLTIRGGSDLAEPFNITPGNAEIAQGTVVVIDDQNPGHLKMSHRPYDTRVAGVVSGANGIEPGIQMHQEGVLEGGMNVALSGRVYVQADTSNGAIQPGDLLTTSSTPGRAMKVTDHSRAAGAILGKAMTCLNEGQGMVLVLVTLQ